MGYGSANKKEKREHIDKDISTVLEQWKTFGHAKTSTHKMGYTRQLVRNVDECIYKIHMWHVSMREKEIFMQVWTQTFLDLESDFAMCDNSEHFYEDANGVTHNVIWSLAKLWNKYVSNTSVILSEEKKAYLTYGRWYFIGQLYDKFVFGKNKIDLIEKIALVLTMYDFCLAPDRTQRMLFLPIVQKAHTEIVLEEKMNKLYAKYTWAESLTEKKKAQQKYCELEHKLKQIKFAPEKEED